MFELNGTTRPGLSHLVEMAVTRLRRILNHRVATRTPVLVKVSVDRILEGLTASSKPRGGLVSDSFKEVATPVS